jgi:hypothetical protein
VGRPAINTALTDPFDTLNPGDAGITQDMAKNLYNSSASPITAPALGDGGFIPWIAVNLAIIDSLDGVCGNQAFCGPADAGAKQYGELATVLNDDELYVDTTTFLGDATSAGCGFLGAELEVTGLLSTTGASVSGATCGGRQPTEDVIDVEYNLLAIGFAGLPPGPNGDAGFAISNGIMAKAVNPPNDTTAPYLHAPN